MQYKVDRVLLYLLAQVYAYFWMMDAISGGEVFQNSVYVGMQLQYILYGIDLALYSKTMYSLLNHPGRRTKSDVFYAIFSTVMLLMITIWVSAWSVFCGKMWLLDASFPGGLDAFWKANVSVWYVNLGRTAIVVLRLMTDALMVYRCWAVWNQYWIIVAPSILWAGTLVLGFLLCWTAGAHTGGLYFRDTTRQLGLAYFSSSTFLTAMVTWIICYRTLRHGMLVKEHLAYEHASSYFAIVALVVESVLPSTLASIIFLALLGSGSEATSAFGFVDALMMGISPQMLILRVVMRTGRTEDVTRQPHSTIKFSPQEDVTLGSVLRGSEALYTQTLGSTREDDDSAV